jgi:hypothetical protein
VDKRWAQSTSQSAYLLGMSEVARSMTPEALAVGPGVIHSQFNKFGQPVPEGALRPPSTEPPTGMYLSGMQTAFTEAADARAAENDPRNLSMVSPALPMTVPCCLVHPALLLLCEGCLLLALWVPLVPPERQHQQRQR